MPGFSHKVLTNVSAFTSAMLMPAGQQQNSTGDIPVGNNYLTMTTTIDQGQTIKVYQFLLQQQSFATSNIVVDNNNVQIKQQLNTRFLRKNIQTEGNIVIKNELRKNQNIIENEAPTEVRQIDNIPSEIRVGDATTRVQVSRHITADNSPIFQKVITNCPAPCVNNIFVGHQQAPSVTGVTKQQPHAEVVVNTTVATSATISNSVVINNRFTDVKIYQPIYPAVSNIQEQINYSQLQGIAVCRPLAGIQVGAKVDVETPDTRVIIEKCRQEPVNLSLNQVQQLVVNKPNLFIRTSNLERLYNITPPHTDIAQLISSTQLVIIQNPLVNDVFRVMPAIDYIKRSLPLARTTPFTFISCGSVLDRLIPPIHIDISPRKKRQRRRFRYHRIRCRKHKYSKSIPRHRRKRLVLLDI